MSSFRHLKSMTRESYLTDLSDTEWEIIEPHLPTAQREAEASAGVINSQSVKTTGVGGEERGYDAEKKSPGGNVIS